jgi:hypothetical protein
MRNNAHYTLLTLTSRPLLSLEANQSMRTSLLRLPLWLRVLFVFAIAIALPLLFPHTDGAIALAGVPLMLNAIPRTFGRTYEQLKLLMKPVDADEPEAVPWVLYDTQQYAQAGSAKLTFFNSATVANASDPTLSNFATGVLEGGYYFEAHRVHVIIHSMPNTNATVAITGGANDVEILHKTARGILSFKMKSKQYGPLPLAYCGRPGGPVPIYSSYGTGTAANNVITAGETAENGGFPYLGSILIPPVTNFVGTMDFNSTAISAATYITVGLMGILHRPVA